MNMHKDNMTNEKNIKLMDDNSASDSVVEEQIAHNIVELLNNRAQHLTAADEQRLFTARNMAVNHLAAQQVQVVTHRGADRSGHALRWFGSHVEQHRVISAALMVGAMLLTFFAVQQFGFNNNLEKSDAFLLASDLPPEAYADKGFSAWLDTK